MRLRHALAIATSLALGAYFATGSQTVSAPRTYDEPKTWTKIEDARVNESSGIAASQVEDDVYYTHNDSGDGPRFFKFDASGKVLGEYTLEGAKAIDWEDMASAVVDGKPYLYFGDIGDNGKIRVSIEVYRVLEPLRPSGKILDVEKFSFQYPDGPENAEALMVRPGVGDLYIVTKTSERAAKVFKAPRPQPGSHSLLQEIGTISIDSKFPEARLITGGDISPDGKRIVLRTYFSAYEFDVPDRFDQWVVARPRYVKLAFEPQGEGICFSRNGRNLLTTTEGSPCTVSIVTSR